MGGRGGAGRATAGGAMGGVAGGTAGAPPDAVGGAGATPIMVLFKAAIGDGGGLAGMVAALCTSAGAGTLIGLGKTGGFAWSVGGTSGCFTPRSAPTPTIVDLSGDLGRWGEAGDAAAGAGGAIGGAAAGVNAGLTGAAVGFAAGKSIAGVVTGVVTRKECPHFGHRIFRPAGGTRRSSI